MDDRGCAIHALKSPYQFYVIFSYMCQSTKIGKNQEWSRQQN